MGLRGPNFGSTGNKWIICLSSRLAVHPYMILMYQLIRFREANFQWYCHGHLSMKQWTCKNHLWANSQTYWLMSEGTFWWGGQHVKALYQLMIGGVALWHELMDSLEWAWETSNQIAGATFLVDCECMYSLKATFCSDREWASVSHGFMIGTIDGWQYWCLSSLELV